MKKQSIVFALVALGIWIMPCATQAAAIQDIDGGGIVYMDNAEGPDMIVADDFTEGGPINWDVYVSSNPTQPDSWELARTYKGKGVVSDDPQIVYNMMHGQAVEFNGAWYFVVNVQRNDGITLGNEQIQVWRISTLGGKPKLVLTVDSGMFWYTNRIPLFVLNGTLHFVDPNSRVHRSSNGTTWQDPYTLDHIAVFSGAADVVSNGSVALMADQGKVYRSTDAENWTQVGDDLCATTAIDEYCTVKSVQKRSPKGIFAITETYAYSDYANITTDVWVYKHGAWLLTDSAPGSLTPLVATDGQILTMHTVYVNDVSKSFVQQITKAGVLQRLSKKRAGTAMGILAKDVASRNPVDATFIRLHSFGAR